MLINPRSSTFYYFPQEQFYTVSTFLYSDSLPHSQAPQVILWMRGGRGGGGWGWGGSGLIFHIEETPSESHHWICNCAYFCTCLLGYGIVVE